MSHRLDAPLALLVRDFLELRARDRAFVLATVITTDGSTYRKAGTQMLISADSELRGLLSGGCLEVDLIERARTVLADGQARLSAYDMRGPDDVIFGLGSGCEGAMQILLQRVGPAEDWQPLAQVAACAARGSAEVLALIVDGPAAGHCWWTGGSSVRAAEPAAVSAARQQAAREHAPVLATVPFAGQPARVLALPLQPPPALLVLGAGPDAVPLARFAAQLGFLVTVCDHRPALAQAARFAGCTVHCLDPARLAVQLSVSAFDAAVIMSHHLPSDRIYLEALAAAPQPGFVGLLGPAARRERLLSEIGPAAAGLTGRLRAPVGLDIGARTPEAIALAVIAEIHAWIAGRRGRPFSEAPDTPRP